MGPKEEFSLPELGSVFGLSGQAIPQRGQAIQYKLAEQMRAGREQLEKEERRTE
jgi:hypothetical protein